MKRFRLCLSLVLLSACTEVDPKVGGAEKVDGPKLSAKSIVITNLSGTVTLAGTCDLRSKSMQMSFDGTTWAEGVGVASTWQTNCSSSKSFNIVLDLTNPTVSAGLGFTNGVGGSRTVWLRGQTIVGASKADGFVIEYRPPVAGGGGQVGSAILGGYSPATTLTSGSFRLTGRIGVPATGGSMSSSNFRLKTGLQNQ